jgi:hypothetical protein
VPEYPLPPHLPLLVADLHIEISDRQGATSAHLTSGPDVLWLDVSKPDVLLRAMPTSLAGGGSLKRLLRDIGARYSLVIRTDGQELGRARLGRTGRVRVRPSRAGVLLVIRTLIAGSRGEKAGILGLFASAWVHRTPTATVSGAGHGHHDNA